MTSIIVTVCCLTWQITWFLPASVSPLLFVNWAVSPLLFVNWAVYLQCHSITCWPTGSICSPYHIAIWLLFFLFLLLLLLLWIPAALDSCTLNNGDCGKFSTCTSTGPGTNTCRCFTNYVSTARPRDGTKCAGLYRTVIKMDIGLALGNYDEYVGTQVETHYQD